MQDLESRLGARLLHRTTRRLSLTEAGQDYYQRATQILAEFRDADAVASQSTEHTRAHSGQRATFFGVLHLAPVWGSFLALHPEVSLEVTLADRVVNIVDEGYDLAIRIARLPDSTLVSRKLATTRDRPLRLARLPRQEWLPFRLQEIEIASHRLQLCFRRGSVDA